MPNINSNLLTAEEKIGLYDTPVLSDVERTEYFTLSDKEIAAMKRVKETDRAIYFVICLVFLKIKQTLVNFRYQDVTKERQHVMQRYFPNKLAPRTQPQDKDVIRRLENLALKLCGSQRYSGTVKDDILNKLQKLAPRCPRQRKLCQEFIKLLAKNHIAIPAYSTIQEAVSNAWNNENTRVAKSYYRYTTSKQRNIVLFLLEKTDKEHRIVSIKQDMKSFNNTELNGEIDKYELVKPIFEIADKVIPKLQLPTATVEYYASMVHYYNGSRFQKIDQDTAQIYLLCYSFTRYQMLNDNLLETMKKRTNDYDSKGKTNSKEQAAKQVAAIEDSRIQASNLLIAIHDHKGKSVPKSELFRHIPEENLLTVAMLLAGNELNEKFLYWKYIDSIKDNIKLNIRHIFLTIDFVVTNNDSLKNVVDYVLVALTTDKKLQDAAPPSYLKTWIGKEEKEFIIHDDKLLFNRLEFLLYKRIVHHITTNKLTLKHSIKNKLLDDEIYAKKTWDKKKTKILREIGCQQLNAPIEKTLKQKANDIDELYKIVNHDIINGNNQGVKIITNSSGEQSWRLRPLEAAVDPNQSLFAEFQRRSIVDVINFVEHKTRFSKVLESILPRSKKGELDFILTMAAALANAIRIGSKKMADISDLKESALLTAESSTIRTETIMAAVDILNNAAAKLPIFKEWYINGLLHGSLDGVKLEVALRNIKARYSSKYLGTNLGVSAYHAILHCFPVGSLIIGANEYEGNSTFELVEHLCTQELQMQNVSTDKHGTNSLNYGLFDLTGRLFAPRIPKPHDEILWGFGNSKNYDGYIVKPSKFLREKSVISQWDDVQRLVASIITGEASPRNTIRKLSSKNYTSKAKNAFMQYNHIVRSNFILSYIHSEDFRRAIMRALNRGKAYNNLYQAITILKKGEFRGRSEIEIEIWNQCTRLISAIILYYNTYILNSLYTKRVSEKGSSHCTRQKI